MDWRICDVGGQAGLFVHSQQGQLRFFIVVERSPVQESADWPTAYDELFRETFALQNSPYPSPAQWPASRDVLRQFMWTRFSDGQRIVVPHWFPAALSVAFAALFAFKRTWRYSVRTMFIATTLGAVILGFVACAA